MSTTDLEKMAQRELWKGRQRQAEMWGRFAEECKEEKEKAIILEHVRQIKEYQKAQTMLTCEMCMKRVMVWNHQLAKREEKSWCESCWNRFRHALGGPVEVAFYVAAKKAKEAGF